MMIAVSNGMEWLDRWITTKVSILTAAAIGGVGVINADVLLAIIGGLAGVVTIVAGMARVVREILEIRRAARAERRDIERSARAEVRDLNLAIKKIRPVDRLSVDREHEK